MEIEVKDLTKQYGKTQVLNTLSFTIDRGEVIGFLGPNGAGKTTTMRILTGFLAPSSGSVKIAGLDSLDNSLEVQARIGYLPENNPLYGEMKVYEYLEFMARAKGIKKVTEEVKRVVQACGLRERVDQVIGDLSKGLRQRVGLAQALLGDPEIIILDEPTSGLDPNQIAEIRNLIREIGKKKTIILSTHILSEVEASCTRAIIIHQGKIVASGTTAELTKNAQGQSRMRITLSEKNPSLEKAMRELPGVTALHPIEASDGEAGYVIDIGEGKDLRREIFQLCVRNNVVLLGLEYRTHSLEDVFRQLTR